RERRQALALDHRRVLRILVIRIVTARPIQLQLPDVWREDLEVPLLAKLRRDERLKLLPDDRAVGRPQDQPLPDHVVDVEELEVLADDAMVALLCLIDLRE